MAGNRVRLVTSLEFPAANHIDLARICYYPWRMQSGLACWLWLKVGSDVGASSAR
jgi:hypothetical protein